MCTSSARFLQEIYGSLNRAEMILVVILVFQTFLRTLLDWSHCWEKYHKPGKRKRSACIVYCIISGTLYFNEDRFPRVLPAGLQKYKSSAHVVLSADAVRYIITNQTISHALLHAIAPYNVNDESFFGVLQFNDPNITGIKTGICSIFPVFEAMVSLPRSMASSLLSLPRSCHDLGKDAMAMQDRAMANHVLDKGSTVANPNLFGNSQ